MTVTLYITVTLQFPKGDRFDCISVFVFLCIHTNQPSSVQNFVQSTKFAYSLSFYHCRVVLESLAVSVATAHNCSSFVFVVCDFGLV